MNELISFAYGGRREGQDMSEQIKTALAGAAVEAAEGQALTANGTPGNGEGQALDLQVLMERPLAELSNDELAAVAAAQKRRQRESAKNASTTEPPRGDGLTVTRASDVERKELRWLWQDRIPLGKLSILAGDPGLGKSTLTLDIAARVSRGETFPDGSRAPAGSVLLLSAEDDPADTIRPRLEAAGANLDRVSICTGVRRAGREGSFSLVEDIGRLEEALARMRVPALIIIDPIAAYLDGIDSHKNADVRSVLAPLAALAAKHGVAVLAVHHLNKGVGPALYRLSGSLAFTAAARAVWGVCRDPEDEKARLLVPIKMNLAREAAGFRFTVADGPRIAWGDTVTGQDADRLLSSEEPEERSERQEASEWLRDKLAGGPVPSEEIKRESRAAGIAESTLKRAKRGLGVKAVKVDFAGPWTWALSEAPKRANIAEGGQEVHPGPLGPLGASWPPSMAGIEV